ncbi:pentapeptide repeat-containing protein, partial [Pseudoponticoccus marisrubri]|uniref:pentapeptide repeat-containing protein n=1 Tax=Pseudoponticoccus marisrubri TaxID=1685382 RepID=UPI001969CFF0
DLLRLVSLLSHSFVLHLARKPTSGRTTFLGADQLFPLGPPDLSVFSQEQKLVLVLDGLDELSGGGEAALQASLQLVESLQSWLDQMNARSVGTLGLVVGRNLTANRAETQLGLAPHQSLELLPYVVKQRGMLGDRTFIWRDQRQDWWKNWAALNPSVGDQLPTPIYGRGLSEISSEPLLLYIVASIRLYEEEGIASLDRYKTYTTILNRVISNWYRRVGRSGVYFPHDDDVLRVLELIACAAWADGGRSTSLQAVKELAFGDSDLSAGVDAIASDKRIVRAPLAFYLKFDEQGEYKNIGLEFSHKSFCEFLISRRLERQFLISAERGASLLDEDYGISTSPGGFKGINEEIAGFIEDAARHASVKEKCQLRAYAIASIQDAISFKLPLNFDQASTGSSRIQLLVQVALSLLNALGPGEQTLFPTKWNSEVDAKDLLEIVLSSADTNGWKWRHRFTSLVPETPSFLSSRLKFFDFSQQSLAQCRLVGLNFFSCSFEGCDLRGAHFIDCVLSGCSFEKANLQGTCWNGSNISGAKFSDSLIQSADFSFANGITRTQFDSCQHNDETRIPFFWHRLH